MENPQSYSSVLTQGCLFLMKTHIGHKESPSSMPYNSVFSQISVSSEFKLPTLCAWRRRLHPSPVLLPGKPHGWRSLVGCSPWGCWGSDTTERLHFHFSVSCIGEGNGNPLQWSCLENLRDGGAWWAAAKELMLLNCGIGEDSWESLGLQGGPTSPCGGDQSWVFIGRTDAEPETPVLWPPDEKNWFIGKYPDAGKDWRQEEKGMTEDEMVGWHHRLDGHEFE